MRTFNAYLRGLLLLAVSCLSLEGRAQAAVQQLEAGQYYHLKNVAYDTRWATATLAGDTWQVHALEERPNDVVQLWQAVAVGNNWALKNMATGQYLRTNTERSAYMGFTDTPMAFRVSAAHDTLPATMLKFQGMSFGIHAAESQGYALVGWYNDGRASFWQAIKTSMTAQQIADSKKKYDRLKAELQGAAQLTAMLQHFFEDYACTTLRPDYQAMTDVALRAAMAAKGLNASLQDVAIRVKNNTWHTNPQANTYARSFRIAQYGAYSDPVKWARPENKLMVTSFRYSQLTNPTGINAEADSKLYIFVGSDVPEGTTLRAELVTGHSATGTQYKLTKGFNVLYTSREGQLFIYYNIENTNTRLADVPPVQIHIEGGQVNGYFDVNRHVQQDWDNMRALMSEGFLAAPVFFFKSKTLLFSLRRNSVLESDTQKKWWFRGENKGIAGWTKIWDDIHQEQRDMLSVERYADRFNCLLFVDESRALYATNYGVYMGGATTNTYEGLYYGYNNYNGGNVWAIAHEIGHHYQRLFNTAGALECSNNLFSNISNWRMGTMVSRGGPLKDQFKQFNNNVAWPDRTIADRFRMYYQLWLYYVELGHKPTFYKELIDKFRETPLYYRNSETNPSTAKTDFLQFARFCSDVAQEDLTEFFEFHGFFGKTGTAVHMKYGDGFYDGPKGYGKQYLTITQEEIDETKRYLARYPKKRNNLFFIDDRIKASPATNPYSPPGAVRFNNTNGIIPGQASVVGDVGMYTDYDPTTAKPAAPSMVSLDGRTISIIGEGAVGYKVYDENGRLIFVANTHTFTLPESIDPAKISVKVGGGDGGEVIVVQDGEVLTPYTKAARVLVSTNEHAPEYTYTIRNAANPTQYVGSANKAVAEANKAQFAFFEGTTKGQYYIYNLAAQKWLAHTALAAAPVAVNLVATKAEASLWQVEHDNAEETTIDLLPAETAAKPASTAWQWATTADAALQLHTRTNTEASWLLSLTTPPALLTASEVVDMQAMLRTAQASAGILPTDAERLATSFALYTDAAGDNKAILAELIRTEMQRIRTATHAPSPAVGQVYRLKNASAAFVGQTDRVITSSPSGVLSWQEQTLGNVYELWQLQAAGGQQALVNLATGQRIVSATAPTSSSLTAAGELRAVSQNYPGLFLLHFGGEYLTANGTAASGTLTATPNAATRPADALTLDGAAINSRNYVASSAAWLLMPVAELDYPTLTEQILTDIKRVLYSRGAAGAYKVTDTEQLNALYRAHNSASPTEQLTYRYALMSELKRLRTDASVVRLPAPQAGKVYKIRMAHMGFFDKTEPLLYANDKTLSWGAGYDATKREAQWFVAQQDDKYTLTNLAKFRQYMRANTLGYDLNTTGHLRPVDADNLPGYYDIYFGNTHLHASNHGHGAGTSGGTQNYGNGDSREDADFTTAGFTIRDRNYIAGASTWLFYEVEPTADRNTLRNDLPLVDPYLHSKGFVGGLTLEAANELEMVYTDLRSWTKTPIVLLKALLKAMHSPRIALNPNQPYRLRSSAPSFQYLQGQRPVIILASYTADTLRWQQSNPATTGLRELFYFKPVAGTADRYTLREVNDTSLQPTFSQTTTMAAINAVTHPAVTRIVLHGYQGNPEYTLALSGEDNGRAVEGSLFSRAYDNDEAKNLVYETANRSTGRLYYLSAYYLEPVTELPMQIAQQYGSFYYPFAVAIDGLSGTPNGAPNNAYRAMRNTAGSLVVESLGAGTAIVPKHTTAILSQGNYTLRVLPNDATPSWTDASAPLQGVLAPRVVPEGSYVLALVDGRVQFAATNTAAQSLPANKVYIPASAVAGSPQFLSIATDFTTEVTTATAEQAEEAPAIYDLFGRRVQQPTRGLYIINDKKVLVR